MARKKPLISLRRPTEAVDSLQADRFVHGSASTSAPAPALVAVGRPTPEASQRPGVQTSERLNVPAPEGAERRAAASKALVYRKRTDDLRRRMTIYLSEDLSRRLRLYAAEHDQDYSVVLAEALGALLDQKGVR